MVDSRGRIETTTKQELLFVFGGFDTLLTPFVATQPPDYFSGKNSFEAEKISDCEAARIMSAPRATCLAASALVPAVMPAEMFAFFMMVMALSITVWTLG